MYREIYLIFRFVICRTESAVSEFPETAAIGGTLDARFAGDCAASRTVTIPTVAPLISPTGLKANTGIAANSPLIP